MALVVKNLPANAGDVRDAGSSPELGGSPGGGHGNLLQYSCLENPRDRGAWQATVHGVAELDITERITHSTLLILGFPGGASGKEAACQCRRHEIHGFTS